MIFSDAEAKAYAAARQQADTFTIGPHKQARAQRAEVLVEISEV
jgi:hypothetical protein